MAVLLEVGTTADVDPIVATVGGFHNQLIKVGVVLQEVEPLLCELHVGVALVVIPVGVGVEWHMDDGRFAQEFSMLQATASHLGPRREIRLLGSPQVERKNVTDF